MTEIHKITGHPPGTDTIAAPAPMPPPRFTIVYENGQTKWGIEGAFPIAELISTLEIAKAVFVQQQLAQMSQVNPPQKILMATGGIPNLRG